MRAGYEPASSAATGIWRNHYTGAPAHLARILENTGHSTNAVSMLGQRRRRWTSIETALGESLVFTE